MSDSIGGDSVVVDGKPEPPAGTALRDVLQVSVSPEYFNVLGVPLELGRRFDESDNENSPSVAIVNEAFAREYLSRENPSDRRVKVGSPDGPGLSIVGVVGNEKHQDFFHPMKWQDIPIIFRPLSQEPPFRAFLVFRAAGSSKPFASILQKEIQTLESNVAIGSVQTMNDRLSETLSYPQFRATVLSVFAALALLLAAIGLYAVLSQLVAQRIQEFGIRMALGAQKTDLLKLVLREGMAVTTVGVAAGLMITFSVARLLSSLIYGLNATHPWMISAGYAANK